VIFSGIAVAALFVMRARHGSPTGYRVPLYPVVPAGFLVLIALMAVSSFRYAPGPSVAGLALIVAGVGARLAFSRGVEQRRAASCSNNR
jgi:hypothetical protein